MRVFPINHSCWLFNYISNHKSDIKREWKEASKKLIRSVKIPSFYPSEQQQKPTWRKPIKNILSRVFHESGEQQVDRSKREIREENLQKEEKSCDRKYFLLACPCLALNEKRWGKKKIGSNSGIRHYETRRSENWNIKQERLATRRTIYNTFNGILLIISYEKLNWWTSNETATHHNG